MATLAQSCDRVPFTSLRGLIVAFGLVGLIFMVVHQIISTHFFLVFSPAFIM